MNVLVLDCAFKPTVAIIKNNKLVVENKIESENHSDNFMLIIDKTLKESDLTINNIGEIMLNKGPGSFTGLRVNMSVAKGFGFGGGVNFSTFTSFDYIEGEEILVKGFSNFLYKKNKNGVMSCENVSDLDKSISYVTPNIEVFEKLKAENYSIQYIEKKSYLDIYKLKVENNLKISDLEPLYLRKSQAEMEKEKEKVNKPR